MKSKLDLRLETAKLVVQLPGTTIDNFHERAYRIGLYIQGDAELPEHFDEASAWNNTISSLGEMWKKQNEEHSEWTQKVDGELGFKAPGGMPSSEGERLMLINDL